MQSREVNLPRNKAWKRKGTNRFGGMRDKHSNQQRPCYASVSTMALGILFGLKGMIDLLVELLIHL